MLFNYHTHSVFSDGASQPEEYVLAALGKGFMHLGFSEHSPLPIENSFALQPGTETEYCNTIRLLKEKYAGVIDIHLAMEADYIPDFTPAFHLLREENELEYIIGSVHLVTEGDSIWFIDGPKREIYDLGLQQFFGGDIRKAVTAYWHQINRMLEAETFEVIGHLDKIKMHNAGRYFDETEDWYEKLAQETLRLIREKEAIVEVNTRGIYKGRSTETYPGVHLLRRIKEMGLPVTISSDAHHPSELDGEYHETRQMLEQLGFTELMYFTGNAWKAAGISEFSGRK